MTGGEFARHLVSWVPPLELVRAARRLEVDDPTVENRVSAKLSHPELSSADEACYKQVIIAFLSNFSIPAAMLDIVQDVLAPDLSPVGRERLLALRFTGSVHEPTPERALKATRARARRKGKTSTGPLLVLEDREVLIDVLLPCLRMLTDLIGGYAREWRRAKARKISAFLQHSADGPFAVALEVIVARHFGYHHLESFERPAVVATKFNYRVITTIYNEALREALAVEIGLIRTGAIDQAASTLEPLT